MRAGIHFHACAASSIRECEEAVGALERASGTSLMREAIRQVARAGEEVRGEQEANAARVAEARRQQAQVRDRIAELDGKANYAMGRERDDLAGAAVAKQLALESELARLDGILAEAAERALRLDECAAALAARQTQMERELAAFEASRPADGLGGPLPNGRDRKLRERVGRAQETFDRVMAGAGGAAAGRADPQEAEIDALRRDDAIEARLAAMRAARTKPGRQKRKTG